MSIGINSCIASYDECAYNIFSSQSPGTVSGHKSNSPLIYNSYIEHEDLKEIYHLSTGTVGDKGECKQSQVSRNGQKERPCVSGNKVAGALDSSSFIFSNIFGKCLVEVCKAQFLNHCV